MTTQRVAYTRGALFDPRFDRRASRSTRYQASTGLLYLGDAQYRLREEEGRYRWWLVGRRDPLTRWRSIPDPLPHKDTFAGERAALEAMFGITDPADLDE